MVPTSAPENPPHKTIYQTFSGDDRHRQNDNSHLIWSEMQEKLIQNDDIEIDLHETVRAILHNRGLILGLTLGLSIVTFIISFWFIPRKYETSTYIFVGQPVLGINPKESGIFLTPNLPDIKAVVGLSTSPEIFYNVLRDPGVVASLGDEIILISDLAKMVKVKDVGKDQVNLTVTDTDPERVVVIANTLARLVLEKVNFTYGLGAISETIDTNVQVAQQEVNIAQAAVEDYLAQGQLDSLVAQRDGKIGELSELLVSQSRTSHVLADLEAFDQSLNGLADDTLLPLESGLALTSLRQSSLTAINELQISLQIDNASFSNVTVSDALGTSAQLKLALQKQAASLKKEQVDIESEITQLSLSVEQNMSQFTRMTAKRDQSLELLNALLVQQQRISTVIGQSTNVARISALAVRPDKEFAPNVPVYTIAAGFFGLILSLLSIFLQQWWRSENRTLPAPESRA